MYFPLFLDLSQKEILVVGAGTIASRRIRALCGFAGHITVVADHIPASFDEKISPGGMSLKKRPGEEVSPAFAENQTAGEKKCNGTEGKKTAGSLEIAGTRIAVFERSFADSDLNQKDLVLAATNDAELNAYISVICRARRIPVNVCTDAKCCDFQFPSVVEDGTVVVGINASGKDHRLVKETRRQIEALFDGADFRSRYE